MVVNLLQFHGVPATLAPQRAKLVVESVGKEQVKLVVQGVSPWKSLKQLANQHTPVIQLVLPDELAAVTQPMKDNGVKKAKKGRGKTMPTKPTVI